MMEKYCNGCGKKVTREEYLSIGCDWINSQWMSRFTPRTVDLCPMCANRFIEFVFVKEDYNEYLKNKEEYEKNCNTVPMLHKDAVE